MPVTGLSQGWADLYTSWNMCFVLNEFPIPMLGMLLPKLFLPSVVSAEPKHFLSGRLISLWLTICFASRYSGENPEVLQESSADRETLKKLATIFGEINRKHAVEIMRREGLGVDEQELARCAQKIADSSPLEFANHFRKLLSNDSFMLYEELKKPRDFGDRCLSALNIMFNVLRPLLKIGAIAGVAVGVKAAVGAAGIKVAAIGVCIGGVAIPPVAMAIAGALLLYGMYRLIKYGLMRRAGNKSNTGNVDKVVGSTRESSHRRHGIFNNYIGDPDVCRSPQVDVLNGARLSS